MVDGTAAPLGSVREMLHGIKLDECPALLRTMLAKFDKNGNGIIDPDELPIANDDGISIKAFPENVQPILREMDEEGNGKLEMGELTEMATTYAELKKANKEGSIAIKTLPKELQPTLKVFDVDGDGTVAPMELARGAELYKDSKKTAKRLTIFSGVLLLILCALVGVIVALTAVVVEASKETKTDSKTGITFAKGSSKASATGKVTNTQTLFDAVSMSSSQLRHVESLTLERADGSELIYSITGAETQGVAADGTASAVLFYAARGDVIKVTARKITVTKADGTVHLTEERTRAGGRHLQSAGGSTMLSTSSSDSGGYASSNNAAAAWTDGAGTTCHSMEYSKEAGYTKKDTIMNKPDGSKCNCHSSCAECAFYDGYKQSNEDCLTCADDSYEHTELYQDKSGTCTKKPAACKALQGVSMANMLTKGSCKSEWTSSYCQGTQSGCPAEPCDRDPDGSWCYVDDTNWCYCDPPAAASTPKPAPAPTPATPPKHICITHVNAASLKAGDPNFKTIGICADEWAAYNGKTVQGCGNPDDDPNGAWCTIDGDAWCHCRDISDGTAVSTFDELKEELHEKTTGASKLYITSNIQWPDTKGTPAIALKRSVEIIGACGSSSSYSLPEGHGYSPESGKPEDGVRVASGTCLLSAHSTPKYVEKDRWKWSREICMHFMASGDFELSFEALAMSNGGGYKTTGGSPSDGGGSMELKNLKKLTIKSVIFVDNENRKAGGAFSLGDSSTDVSVESSYFIDNNVDTNGYGGAIQFDGSTINMKSTIFIGNKGGKGGAIYLTRGTMACENCAFQGNRAHQSQCGMRSGHNVYLTGLKYYESGAYPLISFKQCSFDPYETYKFESSSCAVQFGIMESSPSNGRSDEKLAKLGPPVQVDPATTRVFTNSRFTTQGGSHYECTGDDSGSNCVDCSQLWSEVGYKNADCGRKYLTESSAYKKPTLDEITKNNDGFGIKIFPPFFITDFCEIQKFVAANSNKNFWDSGKYMKYVQC